MQKALLDKACRMIDSFFCIIASNALQEGDSYAAVFMKIITVLSTPDAVKYGLTLIDDALQGL